MSKTFFSSTLIVLALLAGVVLLTTRPAAATPDCPVSWPDGDHQGFYTDADGAEWFIIRSTDSNGYTTVRAYKADDRYAAGYAPGEPDQVCYLLVRRPGAVADLTQPNQVRFARETDSRSGQSVLPTLLEILNGLPPGERQAAIICLLPLAGSRTIEELSRDPNIVQQAIELGCLSP